MPTRPDSAPSPRVLVLATGGTIAAVRGADGALAPGVGVEDLLAAVPASLRARVRVEARRIMSIDSAAMDLDDAAAIARAVLEAAVGAEGAEWAKGAAAAAGRPDGLVVLHGTDTMEESALLADLTLASAGPTAVPVVFTGAQRSADHPEPDGPANLAFALESAAGAPSRGVAIAFHGKILPAWGTRKSVTTGLDGFAPWPDPGAALRSRDQALAALHSTRAHLAGLPLPRVDTVALYPGADATALEAFLAAGARGIVVEALGAGNANPAVVEAVRAAAGAGVPVVVTTRVADGPVFADYGGGGGGADLAAAGAVSSPVLRAGQARVLLAALLAAGAGPERISRAFAG